MNVYSLARRSWLWGEGEETASWISPKPPPALQKLQSKIDSSEQMGNIRGAQERGTPGRGGASPRSWREAPGCCFFLEFCVFQKMKMPKQSYKTCGIYILNVYIE